MSRRAKQQQAAEVAQSNNEPPIITRKMRRYLKLIELYKQHECLWNECSKDFYNLKLKKEIWKQIAQKIKKKSAPETWIFAIYKMRYNVELERLHEEEAQFYNLCDELPPKLIYSDKFQFLNHMFDYKQREKKPKSPCQVAVIDSEVLKTRLDHDKKLVPIFAKKLQTMERLRNRTPHRLRLTPEAYRKLELITSG